MSSIDREIKLKIEDVTKRMLEGKAGDYAAYASLVARYRVLKELDDFLTESRAAEAQGDETPNDDP